MKNQFFTWMCILLTIVVKAQNGGDIDPSFKIGKSFSKSGSINAIAPQSDGKIILGGSFNSYDQITANDVVRLNADGTIDTSFNSGTAFIGNVTSIAIQADGKIVVGGESNSLNGIAASTIIRLNADGSKDNTFITGTGPDSYVYSVAIQADGKIVLGGFFSSYNGTAANGIARLNSNGTIDNTFSSGTVGSTFVESVAIQPDGKIVIGELGSIDRLNPDGSLDPSFTAYSGGSLSSALSLQSDGKIVVGSFGSVVRLNSDGTKDSTFNTGTGFNYSVSSVKIQSDGKIIAGGSFTTYNGASANRAVRLNADGTLDHIFNFGSQESGLDVYDTSAINSIFILSDGKILFGGSTTYYNKTNISGLIKVDSAGVKDNSFNVKNAVYEFYSTSAKYIVAQADGKIIVGGDFNYYFGTLSSGIVRLNTDGTKDNSLNIGTGLDNGSVRSIVIQSDGKIVIGGRFSSFNGNTVKNLIRLNTDGSVDNAFNMGTGFNAPVNAIAIQPNGKIFAGGEFNGYNDVYIGNLVRLNADGSLDNSFNIMAYSSSVHAIALQADGKIVAAGFYFTRLNQDGTTDNTFNKGSGFSIMTTMGPHQPNIVSMTAQADGKILVSGVFNNYNGTTVPGFVRLNTDGTADKAFVPETNGSINCMAVQSNGKLLLGISTNPGANNETNNIIRLNPDGRVDTSFNGHLFDHSPSSLMIQSDGKIIASGVFTIYDGKTCLGIVRILGDSFLSDEDFSQLKLSIYPNPARYSVNIQLPTDLEIDAIIVTDLTGKMILRQGQSKEIDVENLTAGVYIIQAYSGQSKWQSKFIKE